MLLRNAWYIGAWADELGDKPLPAPLGGGLVKAEWFKRYAEKDRPERFDRIGL
jgi:hypothetical protein